MAKDKKHNRPQNIQHNFSKSVSNVDWGEPSPSVLHKSMDNWIIDTSCPFYEDFLPLFKHGMHKNSSNTSMTFNGWRQENSARWSPERHKGTFIPGGWTAMTQQTPPMDQTSFDNINWKRLMDWVNKQLNVYKVIKIKSISINACICLEYNDGGWTALHHHGKASLSLTMSMDYQPPVDEPSESAGVLYALLPAPDGTLTQKQFRPYPGRTVFMPGSVWHGVHPAKAPRRTFVVEFNIKT
jgi:hypothetical protein